MEHSSGKLKSLTLVEKLKLIEIVEMGRAVKDVAEEFAINRNTLHYILKNRDKIREGIIANPGIAGFKRIKQTKSPELEQRVLEYMLESRANDQKLSGSIIKTVALEFAAELGVANFAGSNGWLHSFFKRNKINISDFNKGVDPYSEASITDPNKTNEYINQNQHDSVTEKTQLWANESNIDEDYQDNNESEEHANNTEDDYTIEMIDEELEESLDSSQIQEDHLDDVAWKNWCRLCGKCDTMTETEPQITEIVHNLLNIISNDVKICEECNASVENIFKMVLKGRAVESMLMELNERERREALTIDKVNEIRREFGFESEEFIDENELTEIHFEEEPLNIKQQEASKFKQEEVIYDDIEEDLDNLSVVEEMEYEHDDEEFIVTEESLPNESESHKNSKRSIEEDMYEYKCHVCNEIFDRLCFLSNHTRTMHQCMPKVPCNGCGRNLSTWDSLMAHKRKHSPEENNFNCDSCNSSFRTKTGLSIHIKFKHEKPTKIFRCATCGHEFKDNCGLKSHLRTHLPDEERLAFECEICGKRMVNKFSLKYHISTIHEMAKNYFCYLCGRGFGNKSNLRSHLISHSTENVSCEICGGTFKNRISLQSHKKVHKPKHLLNFVCKTCNKGFHSRNHLMRHEIAHSDERGFKCPFANCLNEYKWQKDLNNHMAGVHTGERPHKCPFCDKTFVDSANARKHKVKEHPKELAAFEAQYGKGRRISNILSDRMEVSLEEIVE